MPVQFDLRENPAAGVKGCLKNCVLCPYPHKKCLVAERGMAERKRTWGWRMWPRGVEKQQPPWGDDHEQDEKAVAEKAYPASYNVLLTRLATMVGDVTLMRRTLFRNGYSSEKPGSASVFGVDSCARVRLVTHSYYELDTDAMIPAKLSPGSET